MELTHGLDVPKRTQKSTSVCIIGAGPAGITLALSLNKAGIEVILLEGSRYFGPFNTLYNERYSDKLLLYNGNVSGLLTHNEPTFLVAPRFVGDNASWERERYLGGTSLHWGGQCRPLDPITFEAKGDIPAWPINREDLNPFYKEAYKFCGLYNSDNEEELENWEKYFTTEFWAKELNNPNVPQLENLEVTMYQFIRDSQHLRFDQKLLNSKINTDCKFEVITNATALEMTKSNNNIKELAVGVIEMTGHPPIGHHQFSVKADAFVLACGGVANARQLLLNGFGETHSWVGKNFITQALVDDAINLDQPYLSTEERDFLKWQPAGEVAVTGRIIPNEKITKELGLARCWFRMASNHRLYWEQSPNPESKIVLADTPDPVFNQQQTEAIWQLNDYDKENYAKLVQIFLAALNKRGFYPPIDSFISWEKLQQTTKINGHHLGTTKMSNTIDDGVVDKNLQVHGMENLFVAGSSVFPTGGLANPTFTIVALSIRLASYLTKKMGKE